ncbi:MAG: hypothetical protein LBJ33_14175 [Pseudomonas putida]|jgi:hypothetical protein|nr:hypothetical protein [Pseudomonas putida]
MRVNLFKINKNRFSFLFALLTFRSVLDYSYYYIVSDIFAYEGFLAATTISQYALSWLLYIISFGFVSDRVKKVSHYFFAMAVLSVVAPLTSLYGLDDTKSLIPVLVTLGALYIIYYISRFGIINLRALPVVPGGRSFAVALSLTFVCFLVIWFLISGARPNLDFREVYQYREVNSQLAAGGIFSYTNNWTYQVFSIYLISFALYYRKYIIVFLLLLIQLYFFSIASHKAILFLPFLVFGSWMYFRFSNSLLALPIVFTAVLVVTITSYIIAGDIWLTSLLSRRVFFVPANLCFVYFDFFGTNPNVYWSNSILSAFLTYPYGDLGVPYVIGEYLGRPGMGANNGFVSSGFAHAGLLGVVFYSVIIGVILKLLNDMTRENMPIWVAVALSVVPLRSLLTTSDLFTVMLTHGFGIAIVLIYLSRVSRSSSLAPSHGQENKGNK